MKHWTDDHGARGPRPVCTIKDITEALDGGAPQLPGEPIPPPQVDESVVAAFGRRNSGAAPTPEPPGASAAMDGAISPMDAIFGRRRQDPEGTSRGTDRAEALEAARKIREEMGVEDGGAEDVPHVPDPHSDAQGAPTTGQQPEPQGQDAAPPAIDYDALARAYFTQQAQQAVQAQQARIAEEPQAPAKRRLLSPDDPSSLARHLAVQVLGPAAEHLADEDLDAIGREQIELLRLSEAVREYGDDPEHGPRLKQQLAQRQQAAYTRKLESALAERDQRLARLEQRLEEIAQAPQRQQEQIQVRMTISQQLAGTDFAQALPTLHQLAASGEEEAGALADEIMAEAKARGVEIHEAASEIEKRYARVASRFATTATAAGQTRPQARPNVTQRDAAGSPTRPHPETLTREEWEKRSRDPNALREYAFQGAAERRRALDRG